MHSRHVIIGICLLATAYSQTNSARPAPTQERVSKTQHAKGSFEVKLTPQKPDSEAAEASKFGRMSLDKQFRGDLEGTSKGEMIGAQTETKGSAGYVAMERVTGRLKGRSGSFVLQHSGSMHGGTLELSVTVVPDSGTNELKGLVGKMNIIITEGKHFYDFDYTVP